MSNTILRTTSLAFALLLIGPPCGFGDELAFPIKVSDNGRYFVDRNAAPFFWLSCAQWQLFHDNTIEEARTILKSMKEHGFNVVHVKLLAVLRWDVPSVYGELPVHKRDPLVINEMYLQQVDAMLRIAREYGITVAMAVYYTRWEDIIDEKNARAYGQLLGKRYANDPNIIWTSTPDVRPEILPVLRELAAGLRETDTGKHLMTFMPFPPAHSSSFAHDEPWMDFHSVHVYRRTDLMYPLLRRDYEIKPAKPIVMAEGAYESTKEDSYEVTPLGVRRQAYYSYLAGAFHGYGHMDSWQLRRTWKDSLDSPGAQQMRILKKVFTDRNEWWNLVPDQDIFVSGGQTSESVLNLAARHKDGDWGLVYLGDRAKFSIDMSKFAGAASVDASWIDPKTGDKTAIGKVPPSGAKEFVTPDGWEDALLVLERSGK